MPRPENLTVREQQGKKMTMVEGDVYNICSRIKEIDPNLRIVLHEGADKPWVVLEKSVVDGEERFVSRYAELDGRILDDLRYMLAVPFEKRIQKLEHEIEANNSKIGKMTEEQIDQMAHAFKDAAVKSNMIDPVWGRSYRNLNKKGKA